MAKDSHNLEIKIKLHLKKLLTEEYESIMKLWKRYALKFEKDLRRLADDGVISFKILDDFTRKFKFDELHRLRFTTPEEPEIMAPRPGVGMPAQPIAPQYSDRQVPQPQTGYGQPQVPVAAPIEPIGGGSASAPRLSPTPSQPIEALGSARQENPSYPTFTPEPIQPQTPPFQQPPADPQQPTPGSFSDLSNQPSTSRPSTGAPPSPTPSSSSSNFNFNVPGLSSKPASPSPGVSLGVDEEDRATGIAILRKKMLTELRKIRSVVEQEGQDDSF